MPTSQANSEFQQLLSELVDGQLDAPGLRRFENILAASPELQRFYDDFMTLHGMLLWRAGPPLSPVAGGDEIDPIEFPQIPSGVSSASPPIGFFGAAWRSTADFLANNEFVVPYLTATVFVCLLLLGFWAHQISHDHDSSIADSNSRGLTVPGTYSHDRPAPVFVGRVTGMAGAKWSDEPNYIAPLGVRVALGRTYKLKTGLLEITYDSGAKVILEGPCSYEVDSTAGGYLSLGKLTARIEDRGEGIGGSGMKADSLATRHQPLATDPSPLSSLPSPLFTVRTPTSVVTDLGTEFGVEVNESGDTTSHVFQGTVLVQAGIREIGDKEKKRPATAVAGGQSDHSVTLVAGQTLCVGTVHETHQDSVADALVRFTQPAAPPQFARRIYTPPKVLDLLDIVAGGDGRGNRRERGIDPTSGCEDPVFIAETRRGDGVYRPVPWHRLIDGVVVPERHADRMQLDSAEHVFEGMHKNTGIAGLTYGSIWARAAEIAQPRLADEVAYWVYSSAFDEKFSPEKRGMLCLHASAGITFDLEAMRKMYKETRPARFRAVVGLADVRRVLPSARAAADVWVFIDGRMVFERPDLRWKDGAIPVDVPLGKSDRFLTLASTDSGSGHAYDNVVFGDPVLEMASTVSENLKEGLPMDR